MLTLAVAALGLLATQRRWRRAYAHEQALAQENALLHARWPDFSGQAARAAALLQPVIAAATSACAV